MLGSRMSVSTGGRSRDIGKRDDFSPAAIRRASAISNARSPVASGGTPFGGERGRTSDPPRAGHKERSSARRAPPATSPCALATTSPVPRSHGAPLASGPRPPPPPLGAPRRVPAPHRPTTAPAPTAAHRQWELLEHLTAAIQHKVVVCRNLREHDRQRRPKPLRDGRQQGRHDGPGEDRHDEHHQR